MGGGGGGGGGGIRSQKYWSEIAESCTSYAQSIACR